MPAFLKKIGAITSSLFYFPKIEKYGKDSAFLVRFIIKYFYISQPYNDLYQHFPWQRIFRSKFC
ncbi:hypothetical protein CW304_04055 [Bacillus sp. UFRGS-B20]|nr:hypothetical protein CW304_04055 [Bacillus sp. UFRGS-B20]